MIVWERPGANVRGLTRVYTGRLGTMFVPARKFEDLRTGTAIPI